MMQIYKLTKKNILCRENIVYVCGQESQDSCGLKFSCWIKEYIAHPSGVARLLWIEILDEMEELGNYLVRSRKTPVD